MEIINITEMIKNKERNKIRLCITKYSGYSNNYDNCIRQDIEGCDNCDWLVSENILKMFEYFEKNGFPKNNRDKIEYAENLQS